MELIQMVTTIIKASAGKVLRRKSDRLVYGDTVHLGYNYYEGGLPSGKRIDTPDDFEEIDAPDDSDVMISDAEKLLTMSRIIRSEVAAVNDYALSPVDSLSVKELYPRWGIDITDGADMPVGFRFQYVPPDEYSSVLYEVVQEHSALLVNTPGITTAALYKVVCVDADGSADDPIAYTPPMEIFEGKYYTQNGVKYKCVRGSGQELSHNLSDLAGLYVEVVG